MERAGGFDEFSEGSGGGLRGISSWPAPCGAPRKDGVDNHPDYISGEGRGQQCNCLLSAPPRGYNWVQTGGDYVLVAIATGIIAQILLGQ